MMYRVKRHWIAASLVVMAVAILFFWMGYIMDELHYREKVREALNQGNTLLAIKLCTQWHKRNPDAVNDPMYRLAVTSSFHKRGDAVGVQHNLNKMPDLLRD